jgi:peroxiredoxin
MKFVLALALICAIPSFSFSQAPTNSGNPHVDDLLAMVDSLRSDPAFQADLNDLAEGLLSLTGMSPQSILHTPLPDFSLTDLKGNTITNEDLFGKIVFLHIWHPDYVASPELNAQLNELRKAYRHQEVLFLSLTSVQAEYLEYYLKKQPLNFQHIPGAFSLINQISLTPQNMLVDREGIIRYTTTSFTDLMLEKTSIDHPAVREQIDALLVE